MRKPLAEKVEEIDIQFKNTLDKIEEIEKEIAILKKENVDIRYFDLTSQRRISRTMKRHLQVRISNDYDYSFDASGRKTDYDEYKNNFDCITSCVSCEFINEFSESSMIYDTLPYDIMLGIVEQGRMNDNIFYYGYYTESDVMEMKDMYTDLKDDYPNYSNEQIERKIAFTKKPRTKYEICSLLS